MAITQTIPLYSGVVPNRNQSATDFRNNADDWLAYQAPLGPFYNAFASQANSTATQINSDAVSAAASEEAALKYSNAAKTIANFYGAWDDLIITSLPQGATVFHLGTYWVSLVPLTDAPFVEPGVDSRWAFVPTINGNVIVERLKTKATLLADFVRNNYRLYEAFGLEPKQLTDVLTTTSSINTYQTPTGIASAAVDTPIINYLPDGRAGGLVCQESRTNALLHNTDFSQSAWIKSGDAVLSAGVASPLEGVNFTTVTASSGAANDLRQVVAITDDGSPRTGTWLIKEGTATELALRLASTGGTTIVGLCIFNFTTGAFTTVPPGFSAVVRRRYPDGSYLVSVTAPQNGTNANIQFRTYPSSGTGVTYHIAATQLEKGEHGTELIITGGSAVNRPSSDNDHIVVGQRRVMLYAELTLTALTSLLTATPYCVNLSDGTTSNFAGFFTLSADRFRFRAAFCGDLTMTATAGERLKVAFYIDDQVIKVASNKLVGVQTLAATSAVNADLLTNLRLGRLTTQYGNCIIHNMIHSNAEFSDAELIALTAV